MVRKYSGNEKGFTLIELLIVIAIISILAVVAASNYTQFKTRAQDADAKANLQNIYLTCKLYWIDTNDSNDCTLSIAANATYGFTSSPRVTVTTSGDLSSFSATASHSQSSTTFTINSLGTIS